MGKAEVGRSLQVSVVELETAASHWFINTVQENGGFTYFSDVF